MSLFPVAVLFVVLFLLAVPPLLSIVVYKHARAHDAENPAAWGAVVWFTGGLAAIVYLISTLLPDPDVPSVHAEKQDETTDVEE